MLFQDHDHDDDNDNDNELVMKLVRVRRLVFNMGRMVVGTERDLSPSVSCLNRGQTRFNSPYLLVLSFRDLHFYQH